MQDLDEIGQASKLINTINKKSPNSAGKEPTCNAGDQGSIPGLGISPGERKGYPLQYSGLENSMGCIVHGVAKSRTRLSNFHSLTHPNNTLEFSIINILIC